MIIERPGEIESIRSLDTWTLVYGRRKTGKTFLVKNYVDWDDYFFVKRDRTVLTHQNETISYGTLVTLLRRNVEQQKVTVVDEFHRLPGDFQDILHDLGTGGRVILISSTLHLGKQMLSANSPLLGLFAEMPLPIISLGDALHAADTLRADEKEKLELAVVLREPIAARFLSERPARKILADVILFSRRSIPALVGEIFSEEERSLSATYEGILRAVADGQVISSGISSYLFSKTLISKDDPSVIQNHLKNLMAVGILTRVPVYNKRRYVYKHRSPLMRLFYRADEKYNISERQPSPQEIEEIVDTILPKIIEDTVREHLAGSMGLTESVAEGKDFEVDACLLKFKRPVVVVEVKWKKKLSRMDIVKTRNSLGRFAAPRKILFVPHRKQTESFSKDLEGIEVMDVRDLLENQSMSSSAT